MNSVMIVAECGVNFKNMDEAKEMIEFSKRAGADAAKFQYFRPVDIQNHPLKDRLLPIAFYDWRKAWELVEFGKSIGITVFFTPENENCVDDLEKAGNPLYKIGHNNCRNMKLFKKIVATEKDMIISAGIGMHVPRAAIIRMGYKKKIRVLYCNPNYPTHEEDVYMPYFGTTYDGFSDHTKDILSSLVSLSRNASILEIHVKMDDNCIDVAVSKTFEELRQIVQYAKRIEKIRSEKICK